MKITLLDKTKKKKFIEEIEYLGIGKIPYLLISTGQEAIRAFSGSLSKEEIIEIWKMFPLESIGLYIGKQMTDRKTGRKESRLSLDALHLLKNQITKNIIVLNEQQEKEWFLGKDVDIPSEAENISGGEFVAVSDGKDFIGTGKISQDKKILFTFLPKERRRKI